MHIDVRESPHVDRPSAVALALLYETYESVLRRAGASTVRDGRAGWHSEGWREALRDPAALDCGEVKPLVFGNPVSFNEHQPGRTLPLGKARLPGVPRALVQLNTIRNRGVERHL